MYQASPSSEATRQAGQGAESEPDLDSELQFSERMLPAEPFDWGGFLLFLMTLGLFCMVTIGHRSGSTYYLAQFARDLVGVDRHFMEVDNAIKYQVTALPPLPPLPCESLCVDAAQCKCIAARSGWSTISSMGWGTFPTGPPPTPTAQLCCSARQECGKSARQGAASWRQRWQTTG